MAYRRGDRIVRYTPSFVPFAALYGIVLALVRVVDWLVFRIRIVGRENLRGVTRGILVSNHTLVLDPGLIAHAIRPRRTYFTMLEETALIPFLGTFVRLLGGLPIPARPGSLLTLEEAARTAFAELGLLHFFPEGECYLGSQELHPFHPGAFLLACRLGAPVVPVTTVLRETRVFGRGAIRIPGFELRFPPRVTIVVGAPVDPPSDQPLKRAAIILSRQVREVMQAAIDIRGGSRALYRGRMPRLVRQPAEERKPSRSIPDEAGARAV